MTALTTLAALLPSAVLETILARLAPLFLAGAGGDGAAARHAAAQLIASYHPCNEEEFFLAASIIGFSFQALEALAQAAAPDLSMTRVLRLRSGAVSLSREADKARRQLAQLQKTRQQAETAAAATPEPATAAPKAAAKTPQVSAAETDEHHQRDPRIAAGLKPMEARPAASPELSSIAAAAALAAGQTPPAAARPMAQAV
jgi:hypothetical protein